jgi:hypothetical protein
MSNQRGFNFSLTILYVKAMLGVNFVLYSSCVLAYCNLTPFPP